MNTDTDPQPLVHAEKLTPIHGFPTGYALCDTDEMSLADFPGGTLAHGGAEVTCQACIDFEPADDEGDE